MTKVNCAACGHQIDAAARLCPYCSSDPRTGEKLVDTQAVLQEVFRPREVSASESVIEYARQRQGLVIGVSVMVIFLALALLHQFATRRSASAESEAPAVPLTEISDLSNQSGKEQAVAMPDLDFQYEGQPKRMQTFIVEAGAITPPDVIAAQQAAQQAAQKQPAAPRSAPPRPTVTEPPPAQTPAAQTPATQTETTQTPVPQPSSAPPQPPPQPPPPVQ